MKELKVGDIIKERYELVRFLGNGSFGEVWLAHDQLSGREVALKIYLTLDPAGIEEFQREYANTIDLSSLYLLTPEYFDVYGRRPFLVMKYCENGSSSKIAGSIREDQLWLFIQDVANGLAVLHNQSEPIVHQDIKPDNILIDGNGRFLISDFGISKRLRATMRRQSKRDVSSGAMPYMAPERFDRNPRLKTASDIWSLGASIYELVVGELPFSGFGGAMQRNGADMPSLPNNYSPVLNEIMQRCLNPEANNRPSAIELSNWTQTKSIPNKSYANQHQTIAKPSATVRESKHQNAHIKSSAYFLRLAILGVLVILVVIAIFVWRPLSTNSGEEGNSQSISLDSLTEQINEANTLTAEQLILSSSHINKDGHVVHFFKGVFYYNKEIYPVMVGFIVADSRIKKAIYKNVTYGGRIIMNYQSFGDEIRLSGKDGNNDFTMLLSAEGDNRLLGTAVEGNKSMTVRLMPTDESFDISTLSDITYSTFNLGDGKIKVPSFLKYSGESFDGGPMFSDALNQIRLFADYIQDQDLRLYQDWVTEEIGNGTILLSKDDCFVQSGYTHENEIYYCKAYMDNNVNPPMMYTAIIIYPISRRKEVDSLLPVMFKPFPNIK